MAKSMQTKYSQKDNFTLAVGEQARIEGEVKRMVGGSVPTPMLVYYIIFGKQIVQKAKNFKGGSLYGEMEILQKLWKGRGLDSALMDTIKSHYVPAYVPVVIIPFKFNISLLDGTDQLI